MRRLILICLVALGGFGAVAAAAAAAVSWRVRAWEQSDLEDRGATALRALDAELEGAYRREDSAALLHLLEGLGRDPLLAGAAACAAGGVTRANWGVLPEDGGCEALAPRLELPVERAWSAPSRSGAALLSAHPVHGLGGGPFVVLAYDLRGAHARARQLTAFLLICLAMAGAAAAALAMVAARQTTLGALAELRAILTGRPRSKGFVPFLPRIYGLVDDLKREREDIFEGQWGPERLRQVVEKRLPQAKVVVANREPYIHQRREGDGVEVLHPASGLVTALEPVMRACGGVWVAHGSGSADKESSDARGCVPVPPGAPSYLLKRVWLTPEEEAGYYYGWANEGLWPLCHLAHERPSFKADDFDFYREVNRRFADAVVEQAQGAAPVVLVQDYHFALLPALLRQRLPRAIVIGFWHIPWPNAERFGICPKAEALLDGLLGCDALGFHTQQHANNFLDSCNRYLEARVDMDRHAVWRHGHTTHVRAWPISVEWPNHWAQQAPPVAECRAAVRAELGLPPEIKLGVGVDRLDYTKGIEERILAVQRLFQRRPDLKGKFVFVQLAAPSRTTIPRYRALADRVAALVEQVNRECAAPGGVPAVVLRQAHHEPPEVFRHYRAADLCYVSSLHDGMNLVAKEFVAAREDALGVLVLSSFTGAARELTEALVVNPYDLEQASAALETALLMSPDEQRTRMQAMRSRVRDYNVYRWAGRMLTEASNLLDHPSM